MHAVLSLTGFLLIEQLLITDGTTAPLNRIRIIYAAAAGIALLIFGITAAIAASRWYGSYPNQTYHHSKNSPRPDSLSDSTFRRRRCRLHCLHRYGCLHCRSGGSQSCQSHHLDRTEYDERMQKESLLYTAAVVSCEYGHASFKP